MPTYLTRVVTAKRTAWIVVLLGLMLAGAFIGSIGKAQHLAQVDDSLPANTQSTQVAQWSAAQATDGSTAIIVFSAKSGTLTPADLRTLGALRPNSAGLATSSFRLIPSQDGTAALAQATIKSTEAEDLLVDVTQLRTWLNQHTPSSVRTQVTGPAAITADLAAVFDGADTRLLLATASIVGLLLIVTYRSPVLWLIPLLVIGTADQLAGVLATRVLHLLSIPWDASTIGILSVLVFGAGTDYALLLISRYRDQLHLTEDRREALAIALRRTAEAVLASSLTVILGVLTLLLSAFPSTRGLGVACAVGILTAAAFALIVLPAALSLFGRWIFWPNTPAFDADAAAGHGLWRRIGALVARRPTQLIVASVLLLAVLSAGLAATRLGLPVAKQFLRQPEAVAAAERIAESFPPGASDPATVLTTADPSTVLTTITHAPGVASANRVDTRAGTTSISVILTDPPSSAAAQSTITTLRSPLAEFPNTQVGGSTAQAVDTDAASRSDRMRILPLILALVLLALIALLRSLLAPLLLILTVVGTYLASLGASWWIFTKVFGFPALAHSVPLMGFLFLVALGVDYNIFLVTRAREEARLHGTAQGMLRALTATGGVITSAGILLAAVIAVLGVLPLVVLAQIGTLVCIGVLLDTLLVRTILVPALAVGLGERFWWPGRGPGGGIAGSEAARPN